MGCSLLADKSEISVNESPVLTEANSYFVDGVDKLNKGQYSEAIAEFDKALQFNPDDAYAYLGRAVSNTNLKRHSVAVEDYKQAISLLHREAKVSVMIQLSTAQYQGGDVAGSIATLDEIIESQLEYKWSAYTYRAGIKVELGLYEEAILDYSAYIQEKPNAIWAYYMKSQPLIELGCFNEALANLDQAYQIQPVPFIETEREKIRTELNTQNNPPAICQSF